MSSGLEEHVSGLSLKDLRALIGEAGLKTDGCIDKADLRKRAVEALERLKLPGAKVGPVSKPIVSAIVAEELGIFDTEEDKERKQAEKEAAERAKEDAAKAKATEQLAAAAAKREQAAKELAEREAAARRAKEEEAAAKRKADIEAAEQQRREEAAEKRKLAAEKASVRKEEVDAAQALISAVNSADVDKLSSLLETLKLDSTDEQGNTALHVAVTKGNLQMVRSLLDAGAHATPFNLERRTPLHNAALFNKVEIAQLLLDRGADPSAVDDAGQTALRYATLNQRDEVAALLAGAEAAFEDHGPRRRARAREE